MSKRSRAGVNIFLLNKKGRRVGGLRRMTLQLRSRCGRLELVNKKQVEWFSVSGKITGLEIEGLGTTTFEDGPAKVRCGDTFMIPKGELHVQIGACPDA